MVEGKEGFVYLSSPIICIILCVTVHKDRPHVEVRKDAVEEKDSDLTRFL